VGGGPVTIRLAFSVALVVCTCVGCMHRLQLAQWANLQAMLFTTKTSGFVGDPWLSIMLTLCHILHSVNHRLVLVYFINKDISAACH
jgi:hypothetical protein